MATARLSDSQKQELVRQFCQGESTQALADRFGCSSTTITRLVRAEMGAEAYATLREQRQKKVGRDRQISLAIEAEDPGACAHAVPPTDLVAPAIPRDVDGDGAVEGEEEPLDAPKTSPTVLAIDDADDFAADEDGEDDLLAADEDGDGDGMEDTEAFHPVPVLPIAVDDQRETVPVAWTPEALPTCAYLLVDKTVELQARPLAEIPDLGRLPSEEQQRQALVLFTNPRQAKRQCGRTQRVIKLPDPALLGRTAPYLLAQGISRVVIEGALYALPDSQ